MSQHPLYGAAGIRPPSDLATPGADVRMAEQLGLQAITVDTRGTTRRLPVSMETPPPSASYIIADGSS